MTFDNWFVTYPLPAEIDTMDDTDREQWTNALRAAYKAGAEAEQQEPVAWRYNGKLHEFDPSDWATGPVTPLYTSPPAKPWVGLTGEEIEVCLHHVDEDGISLFAFARDIEAKLKEKNQ